MKYKKLFFIIIFAFFTLIIFNSKSYAGDLNLNSLNYDVTLNSDGSADVTETWVIDIYDTNTLFKTFEIDKTKYTSIEDVKVVESVSNTDVYFNQQYYWQYHVNENCYYALINEDGEFEIAWGINEKGSSVRTFKISYTIVDAIKNYDDCSEFYWQFISTSSEIHADIVTGKIKLPYSSNSIDDIRTWAHGPLNGIIQKVSNSEITFKVDDLDANTMLEVRVVTPNNVFILNNNVYPTNKLNSILSEEQKWADEANRKREAIKIIQTIAIILYIAFNVFGVGLAVYFIIKIFKYKEILNKIPTIKPSNPQKYFRDIPNKDSTPAQAAFLYYFNNTELINNIPKVISATLLDLCMKKYISFDIPTKNKKDITIILNNVSNVDLSSDEKIVYDILVKADSNNQSTVKLKDFQKYCRSHSLEFTEQCDKINTEAKNIQVSIGNYDDKCESTSQYWYNRSVLFLVFSIFGIFLFTASAIPAIILCVYAHKIGTKYNTLTQKGVDEKELWVGLKNYMEDFSLLKEKEVPDLILWEKYLVYATAFGISEKVLKQLKVIYPQITDYDYMVAHGYTYLYLTYNNNLNGSFISNLSSYVSGACISSGAGAGGGFSGGGGGRRRWRPEWEEDNFQTNNKNRTLYLFTDIMFSIFLTNYFFTCSPIKSYSFTSIILHLTYLSFNSLSAFIYTKPSISGTSI